VLHYEIPVIKHKQTQAVTTTAMPADVLDSSIADVSVLTGLLADKFLYHLPFYRQYSRMSLQAPITDKKLADEKKREHRLTHSKPILDDFFVWCAQQLKRQDLTPHHTLRKALNYVLARENELRVFPEDPLVPMDTNHLEREIRPITLGRKNWLFCWTELGAEQVGLIQSLIGTCKLHDINPNTYLTDVLQRISIRPASKVADLTPRLWKEKFAENPLRLVLQRKTENKNEKKRHRILLAPLLPAWVIDHPNHLGIMPNPLTASILKLHPEANFFNGYAVY
jgi:Transposase IS66 family/IS66 C-terminal element